METYKYKIEDEALVGQRIDKLLSDFNSEWSRSQLQDWIKNDLVTVNGKIIKSNYKVKLNDEIQVTEKEVVEADILPENLNLDIYYEDKDVAIVYKPKGMVVHPSPGHYTGTLVNGLMYQIKDLSGINGEIRPGIVHRIDKDTSGLLMVAKNDVAHRGLVEQLMDKTVKRKYTALVHGNIPHDYGTIDAPIGRNKKDRQSMDVVDDGKEIAELVTTFHQIRVHMKYIGFPLVGDPKYGPRKTLDIGGQALHAGVIGFKHPVTHEYIERHAELPQAFQSLLEDIRLRES